MPSAVLPEVARCRLPIARDSRVWWVAAKKVAKSGCACDSSSNAAGTQSETISSAAIAPNMTRRTAPSSGSTTLVSHE